jgi:hypothetical protein
MDAASPSHGMEQGWRAHMQVHGVCLAGLRAGSLCRESRACACMCRWSRACTVRIGGVQAHRLAWTRWGAGLAAHMGRRVAGGRWPGSGAGGAGCGTHTEGRRKSQRSRARAHRDRRQGRAGRARAQGAGQVIRRRRTRVLWAWAGWGAAEAVHEGLWRTVAGLGRCGAGQSAVAGSARWLCRAGAPANVGSECGRDWCGVWGTVMTGWDRCVDLVTARMDSKATRARSLRICVQGVEKVWAHGCALAQSQQGQVRMN